MRKLVNFLAALVLIVSSIAALFGIFGLIMGDGAEKLQAAILIASALGGMLGAGLAFILVEIADTLASINRTGLQQFTRQ